MTEITELASYLYPLSMYKLQSLLRAGRRKALQPQEEYSLVGSMLEQTYLIYTEQLCPSIQVAMYRHLVAFVCQRQWGEW